MIKLSRSCEECEEDPVYSVRNRSTGRGKPVRCAKHKIEGDAKVGRTLCRHVDENDRFACDTQATFKNEDDTHVCKLAERMVEVEGLEALINTPNLKELHEAEYELKLKTFRAHIADEVIAEKFCFLANKFSLFLARKETVILANLMLNSLSNQRIAHDRQIRQVGSRAFKRPDIFVQLETHDLIIEIDEFRHSWYNSDSEAERIRAINGIVSRPLWVIRFNPDKYTNADGKPVESLFNTDLILKSQSRFNDAMQELNDHIQKCIDTEPDDFEVVFMRYTLRE